MDLYSFMGNMQHLGVFDVLLPFLLFYAIFLGLLSKADPFKKDGSTSGTGDKIYQIISLVLSFFVVAYTPFGMTMGLYLTQLFGGSSTIIIGILALILISGMLGLNFDALWKADGQEDPSMKRNVFLVLLALAAVVWYIAGPGMFTVGISDTVVTIGLLAVIIGTVLYASK
ncbi:MAG: hypothetical protein K0B02_05040 [DPANN group archaeon]|nr:hypothetical protein [DPANN group archaeon]